MQIIFEDFYQKMENYFSCLVRFAFNKKHSQWLGLLAWPQEQEIILVFKIILCLLTWGIQFHFLPGG